MKYRVTFLKILIHLIGPLIFIGFTCFLVESNVFFDVWIFISILLSFSVFVLPQSILLIQYFKVERNRVIEANSSIIKFIYANKTYNLRPASVKEAFVFEAGGYRNPLIGFGFIRLETDSKTLTITSLTQNYKDILNYIPSKTNYLTVGYPNLSIKVVNGKEFTFFQEWLADRKTKEKDLNTEYFSGKFQQKSTTELNHFLEKDGMDQSAISAVKSILNKRKNNQQGG